MQNQKTPKEDRLRQWYYSMLVEAQKRGIVGKVTNMHELYFSNPKNDATCVPYLEGDYFPGEVENTIRSMEEGKNNKQKNSDKGKKKKSKSKNKSKSGRGGTRSTGIDEEALAASGILPPGYDQKSIEEGNQDYVMAKVGEIIAPMKDNFIVAYLACSTAKKEDMVVPKEIAEYQQQNGIRPRNEVELEEINKDEDNKKDDSSQSNVKKDEVSGPSDNKSTDSNAINSSPKEESSIKKKDEDMSKANDEASNQAPKNNTENGSKTIEQPEPKNNAMSAREGKFAAMEARKRTIEGTIKLEEPKSSVVKKEVKKDKPVTTITVKDSKGRLVKVLDDDAEEMDCEFLNTRQLFLELCQTNNYQYDQMRRAKHSSMMVLFHLHNRDAPKFVQQCAICAREILSGYRFHCPTCADFDLCQECHVKAERGIIQKHQHAVKRIPVTTDGKSQQTDEQRRERQRSIHLHMTLLLHAASCHTPTCQSQNCAKMKSLLKHGESCSTKHAGGCNVCKRIYTLLQIHARQCKESKCPVPKCQAFRQRFRQLAMQQRAMDDRRRKQMNIQYRTAQS